MPYLKGCGDPQDRHFGRKSLFCHVLRKNLQKRISKQNETIKRYQEDVSKYRDSLQKEYYVIDALEKQLQEEKLERDKDKEFQKTQNQRITQLENERTALKNTVAEYEKEREGKEGEERG